MYDYLREVDYYGLAYPSAADAVDAGLAACEDLGSGATVLQTLTNTANRGYDAVHADTTVVLAATRHMCPHYFLSTLNESVKKGWIILTP